MIRLIIADDYKPAREAWKLLLTRNPNFSVVADCDSGERAIALCEQLQPDVILMDIAMHTLNGIEATRRIRAFSSSVKVIGLSVHSDFVHVSSMLQAGANGYVTKSTSATELSDAILRVLDGDTYIGKDVEMIST